MTQIGPHFLNIFEQLASYSVWTFSQLNPNVCTSAALFESEADNYCFEKERFACLFEISLHSINSIALETESSYAVEVTIDCKDPRSLRFGLQTRIEVVGSQYLTVISHYIL